MPADATLAGPMLCRIFLALALLMTGGCTLTRGQPAKESDALRDVVQLTRSGAFDDATAGSFSPDGQWIAFRGTPSGEQAPQLFLARIVRDADGRIDGLGSPMRITPAGSRNDSPAFDTEGDSLYFVSTARQTGDRDSLLTGYQPLAEIFRVDGWQRNVAAGEVRRGVDLARNPITRNESFDGEPAVSPNGRFIAFASDRQAPGRALETRSLVDLYLARPDGSQPRRLTATQGYDGAPAWLDANTLVFESDRQAQGRFDLYRLDLDDDLAGGSVVRLTRTPIDRGFSRDPTTHPDGETIVFVRQTPEQADDGHADLWQMRANGDRAFRLTFGGTANDAPAFDATGEHLLFSSRRTVDGSRQLFVARYVRPRRS
jgi:Tol biopolymer transport system component